MFINSITPFRINSNIKTNCRIATGSILTGGCIGMMSMLTGNVTPKDVFIYKNLSNQQKNVVKVSGFGALLVTILTALNFKVLNNKNKSK